MWLSMPDQVLLPGKAFEPLSLALGATFDPAEDGTCRTVLCLPVLPQQQIDYLNHLSRYESGILYHSSALVWTWKLTLSFHYFDLKGVPYSVTSFKNGEQTGCKIKFSRQKITESIVYNSSWPKLDLMQCPRVFPWKRNIKWPIRHALPKDTEPTNLQIMCKAFLVCYMFQPISDEFNNGFSISRWFHLREVKHGACTQGLNKWRRMDYRATNHPVCEKFVVHEPIH